MNNTHSCPQSLKESIVPMDRWTGSHPADPQTALALNFKHEDCSPCISQAGCSGEESMSGHRALGKSVHLRPEKEY